MAVIEAIRQGEPIPVPVIDTHTHIGAVALGGLHQAFEDDASVVKLMDEVGINAIVTSPIVMEIGDMFGSNRHTVNAMRAHPGRIYGNLMICPHDGEEGVKQCLKEFGDEPGFVAMKILTLYHGMPDDAVFSYALDFAQERGCSVTFHYWGKKAIKNVLNVLERHPKLKVILAHQGGGRRDGTLTTLEAVKQCDRLYIDTCGSLFNSLTIKELAEAFDINRMVFGSDILYMEPRFELGRVAFSGLSEEDMKKIYAENYLRLQEGSQMTKIKL